MAVGRPPLRRQSRLHLRLRRCSARLVSVACVPPRASTGCTGDGSYRNLNRTLLPTWIGELSDQSERSARRANPSPWARTGMPAGRLLQGRRALMADSARCAVRPYASSQGSTTFAWASKVKRDRKGRFCPARSGILEPATSRSVPHLNSRGVASGASGGCCKTRRVRMWLGSRCGEGWRRGKGDSTRGARGGCRQEQCCSSCGFWDTSCGFLVSSTRVGPCKTRQRNRVIQPIGRTRSRGCVVVVLDSKEKSAYSYDNFVATGTLWRSYS